MYIHHNLTKFVLINIIIGTSNFEPLRIGCFSSDINSLYPYIPYSSHWVFSLIAVEINKYIWDLVEVHWKFPINSVYFLLFIECIWICLCVQFWTYMLLTFVLTLRDCNKYFVIFIFLQFKINYFIQVYPERKLFLVRFF